MQEWTVLTLTQPYATLVVLGLKTIETRSWATKHRGPLLIHAGLGPGYFGSEAALWQCCLSEPCRTALAKHGIRNPGRLPRGAIIGRVELDDCWPTADDGYVVTVDDGVMGFNIWPAVAAEELAFGDYTSGRQAWLFSEPRQFATPIPARGRPGLWKWEGEIADVER